MFIKFHYTSKYVQYTSDKIPSAQPANHLMTAIYPLTTAAGL